MADRKDVTAPRFLEKKMPFYVKVRAVNRSHRFVPTPEVRQLIKYCLAVTLEEFRDEGKLQLYEFTFLSNEYHLVGMDLECCLPDFMRKLNASLSTELNEIRGIGGSNIEKGYELVAVGGERRTLEHIVHTLAAPVRANLVEQSKQWKSVSSRRMKYGKRIVVKRPKTGTWDDRVKRVRTKMPDKATLVLDRPPVMEHLTDSQLRRQILDWVEELERRYAKFRQDEGIEVLGWQAAVRQDYSAIPTKAEDNELPEFSEQEYVERRALAKAHKSFVKEYVKALKEFVSGIRDTLFPHGTWLMRVRFAVRCEPCASG